MTDDSSVSRYLTPDRLMSPVRDEVETFHETTKLFRATAAATLVRAFEYMSSERGGVEMAHNRREYRLAERIPLPDVTPCSATLDACLSRRRSVRSFGDAAISLTVLSNVLGAARVRHHLPVAADSTATIGARSYPSAGALFPIETYAALLRVEDVQPCIAYYDAFTHEIVRLHDLMDPSRLTRALAVNGPAFALPPAAPIVLFACALFERSTVKYQQRGYRFALLEAGIVSYLYTLSAVANGLGSLHWGGFLDDEVNCLLDLDGVNETIVNCLFVGEPAENHSNGASPQ